MKVQVPLQTIKFGTKGYVHTYTFDIFMSLVVVKSKHLQYDIYVIKKLFEKFCEGLDFSLEFLLLTQGY